MPYTERISDQMFSEFLRGVRGEVALAERHTRLSGWERRALRAEVKKIPKHVLSIKRTTDRQMEIALAVLVKRTQATYAANVAEMSN